MRFFVSTVTYQESHGECLRLMARLCQTVGHLSCSLVTHQLLWYGFYSKRSLELAFLAAWKRTQQWKKNDVVPSDAPLGRCLDAEVFWGWGFRKVNQNRDPELLWNTASEIRVQQTVFKGGVPLLKRGPWSCVNVAGGTCGCSHPLSLQRKDFVCITLRDPVVLSETLFS